MTRLEGFARGHGLRFFLIFLVTSDCAIHLTSADDVTVTTTLASGSDMSHSEEGTPHGTSGAKDAISDRIIDDDAPAYEDIDDVSKRRFDSIASHSRFAGFGKRSFDSIGAPSSFAGFGKRSFDSIGAPSSFAGFGKRAFDSIGAPSSFAGFGKRSFDSIGAPSSFAGFGKRAFDSIGAPSSFNGFGKRSFDSIGAPSSFAGFGKRSFDRIGTPSSFAGFGKRRFDQISGLNTFGKLGDNRAFGSFAGGSDGPIYLDGDSNANEDDLETSVKAEDLQDGPVDLDKRFDKIGQSSFSGFGKRFDRIGQSSFSSFGKRDEQGGDDADDEKRFDKIGQSSFTGFGKREQDQPEEVKRFDKIGQSSFSGFGKREDDKRFDRIGQSSFTGFGKRFDRIGQSSFAGFRKRFDKIDQSSFNSIGKRNDDESHSTKVVEMKTESKVPDIADDTVTSGSGKTLKSLKKRDTDELLLRSAFDPAMEKRRFDSIAPSSSMSRFGKRRFDSIAPTSGIARFGKRRFDSIAPSSSFRRFGRRFDSIATSTNLGFGKRRFDSIAPTSGMARFGKRRFDSIAPSTNLGFGKRSGADSFGRIVDEETDDDALLDELLTLSALRNQVEEEGGKRSSEATDGLTLNDQLWGEDSLDRGETSSAALWNEQIEKLCAGTAADYATVDEEADDEEEDGDDSDDVSSDATKPNVKRAFDKIAGSSFNRFGRVAWAPRLAISERSAAPFRPQSLVARWPALRPDLTPMCRLALALRRHMENLTASKPVRQRRSDDLVSARAAGSHAEQSAVRT